MKNYPTLFGCAPGGGGRVVILGVPYDRATDVARSGCALAPATLRRLSAPESLAIARGGLFDLAAGAMLVEGEHVSDLGDIRFHPHQHDEKYFALVSEAARVITREGKRPLLLGGDHSITLAALRGVHAAGREVQVVQLDAHHDYGAVHADDRPTHATFVGYLSREGLVRRVIQVGVRGLAWGAPEAPPGVVSVSLAELPAALLPDVDVYLTVDTDAFDPGLAPGVGYPEPEGLPFGALRDVLATLAAHTLIGADWTEYNPRYDGPNELTGRIVLRGLGHLIAALARDPARDPARDDRARPAHLEGVTA